MAVSPKVMPLAWYLRDDFQRIREISDNEMIAVFDDWEAKMAKFIAQLPPGIRAEKVVIKPDDLLAFARRIGASKIDSDVRAKFAAFLFMEKQRKAH